MACLADDMPDDDTRWYGQQAACYVDHNDGTDALAQNEGLDLTIPYLPMSLIVRNNTLAPYAPTYGKGDTYPS